jgi:endonuclease YncB( thermonuclease family)
VVGREVIVVERPHHPGVIRVADLYLLDGTHINAWLVQSGLARVGTPWREGEEEAVAALRPLMIEAALARRASGTPITSATCSADASRTMARVLIAP